MTGETVYASPDEMRSYLMDQLNNVLRRPGMYGDVEAAMWMVVNHLLFLERRPEVWEEQKRAWGRQGAWSPTGVKGAFSPLLPPDHGCSVASVYAEFARRQGWLKPDRVLDAEAYAAMRSTVRQWGQRDRVWADVTAAFGPPSVLFGGANPFYRKTLGYLTEDLAQPMVFFHLGNRADRDTESCWPPALTEPLLLAVRCGDGKFADSFTFTPQGQCLRPKGTEYLQ
ncbi:hypothetical protein ABT173_45010 [Streptomyces sp. NPDC001795]|uniref:hypothetical protein n=1 Tax=Streptomyces sp. NPDC001795 TaxID=3154525 RepID=UPI003326C50E